MTGAPATCGVEPGDALTGDGIGDLRVGAPVEEVSRSCRVLSDAIVPGVEGISERLLLVDLGRDTVRAVVTEGRIGRVHVRGRAYRAADSLGVGTPASALRRPGARVLTGEGTVFVALPGHCGLSFRIRGVPPGRASSPEQIPDTALVDEVLAFGCRVGRSDRAR